HETPQFAFNRWIIEQTHAVASAYKPNTAFYEARGAQGWHELRLTIDYLRAEYPDILTICDAKRGDIGSTNNGYARAIFDDLGFDAVTLHPYTGAEALAPFLNRADRACIILCRTSNPGSAEFQALMVDGRPLWLHITQHVRDHWNKAGNCMLVAGATYPDELRQIRELVGDMPLLVPGIGAQGGDIEATVRAGQTADGLGLIINASRSIIFSENPGRVAADLRDAINRCR
ncbi:MAG: orotidine-5'-phosphate decarboxylase, partial [Chloroflexota bacterium]